MGMGGILSLLPQQPSVVSPCEVTFEFTIPQRKAINSQINISPSLSLSSSFSLPLSLSLSHMDVQAIEKTKEIALRKRLYCYSVCAEIATTASR